MSTSYLRVAWKHHDTRDPIVLYHEIDDERWELRKVDVWLDGRLTYADANRRTGDTRLGDAPVPPLDEIAAISEFEPVEVSRAEFEAIWERAIGSRT
jgi:hypothetical protein